MKQVLTLNHKAYTYDQISAGNFDSHPLSDFEKNTLHFCGDWLNGKASFELHTSGSTGAPKKITIQREQMKASASLTTNALGLTAGDTALVCIDTAYIGGKMMLVRGFEAGLNLIAVEPSSDPFETIDLSQPIDFTALVPLQLKKVLECSLKNRVLLDKMKAVIIGGSAIDTQLEQEVQAVKSPVYSTYGMTETVSHIALRRVNGPIRDDFFKVFKDICIDQDERGCLTIQGAVTNHEIIVTNDVVEIIDEHSFLWVGRADNVINSGGVKVSAEKLEQQVSAIAGDFLNSRRFFVAGLKEQRLGEQVTLIVEGAPFPEKTEADLLAKLKSDLPLYHNPKEVLYLPAFVETATRKINRKGSLELSLGKK